MTDKIERLEARLSRLERHLDVNPEVLRFREYIEDGPHLDVLESVYYQNGPYARFHIPKLPTRIKSEWESNFSEINIRPKDEDELEITVRPPEGFD